MFNRFLILAENKEALDNNFKNITGFCNNSILINSQILAVSTSLSKYELRRWSIQSGTFIILEMYEALKLKLEHQDKLKEFIRATSPLEVNRENLDKILEKISRRGIESIQSHELALLNKVSEII